MPSYLTTLMQNLRCLGTPLIQYRRCPEAPLMQNQLWLTHRWQLISSGSDIADKYSPRIRTKNLDMTPWSIWGQFRKKIWGRKSRASGSWLLAHTRLYSVCACVSISQELLWKNWVFFFSISRFIDTNWIPMTQFIYVRRFTIGQNIIVYNI